MRAIVIAALALLAAPATASAAIGQVEPLTLRGDTDCVHAPGAPGEIAVPAKDGVRFLQATRDGLKPGATVSVGGSTYECVRAVTTASGAGVLASRGRAVVVIRDPGGAWGAPLKLPVAEGWEAEMVDAAVSDRGDVLVVWREDRKDTYRFRAVRRAPGGALGPAEAIGTTDVRNEFIRPAIAATGEAFVLTSRVLGTRPPLGAPLEVASAAPGAPFGASVVIGTMPWLSVPSIAAAPDGRVLVAWPDGRSVFVTERAPGAAFGAPVPVGSTDARTWILTSLSVGAGGEATVAWVQALDGKAGLVVRGAPGAFGAPQPLSVGALLSGGRFDPFLVSQTFLSQFLGAGGLTMGSEPFGATALAPGRGLFSWFVDQPLPAAPALITTPLTGGPPVPSPGGRELTSPATSFPVVLPDGGSGMAWVEDMAPSPTSTSEGPYRLHFAAEGVVARPTPPAPRVTVGAPRKRVLSEEATLRLPVRCSGPCEVRAHVPVGLADIYGTLRLDRAGSGTLAIRGAAAGLTAPRGRVPVVLSYRAHGGEAKSRTLRIALARPAGTPDTRVRGVRAVRRGDTVRVTWRTRDAVPEAFFYVTASRTRDLAEEPEAFRDLSGRRNRRAFAVTLPASSEVRFVMVRSIESIVSGRPAIVRVR